MHGGAEKVLVNLVNNLDSSKYEVTLFSIFDEGVNKEFLNKNIKYRFKFKNVFRGNSHFLKLFSPKFLYQWFVKEEYDIAISFLEGPAARIISGCQNPKTKKIAWIHTEIQDRNTAKVGFRTLKEAQKQYEKFDRIIGVSQNVVEGVQKFITTKTQSQVLYNVNETQSIIEKGKEQIDAIFSKDIPTLISVGKIVKIKGFDRLLEAHQQLIKEGMLHEIFLVGIGAEEENLAKKANATSGYQLVLQTDNRIRIEWGVGAVIQSAITNTIIPNLKWHNIAVTYGSNSLSMYIDGVLDKTVTISIAPAASVSTFNIGSQYQSKTSIINLFKGDIDELRMWNRVLTPVEIQFIMNQEILQNVSGTRGTIIPTTITKNDINTLNWNNLFAYYSMNSYIGTHLDDDSVNINRGSLIIPDKVSINIQTAPMPYISDTNDLWQTPSTWKNGANQDQPYSLSIVDNTTRIGWNIVRTTHNITSPGNKTVLGLFVDSNTLSATNDTQIEVSHYLKLNGKIDLVGRSQLIQKLGSDLDPTSSGSLERDQQGQGNRFNYNYWSSPVGPITTIAPFANNKDYNVDGVLRDGTNPIPGTITWVGGYNGALSPFSLARYWIYKFDSNVNAIDYANWTQIGETGMLQAGKGFTLKGAGTSGTQNLTFIGKPNNGTITNTVGIDQLLLVGNPYPSALDAKKFINDNINVIANTNSTPSIDGTLYFWEHYSTNNSHNLAAYQGGYAIRNLSGGLAPSSTGVDFISGSGTTSKSIPNQFIPVGQGFFVIGNLTTGGTVTFNNSQREFIIETNATSQELYRIPVSPKTSSHWTDNSNTPIEKDTHKKIRLGFNVIDKTFHRQVLLAFMDEKANSEMNDGYDAFNIDDSPSDMYLLNGENELAIQGEGYFDENASFPIGVRTETAGKVSFGIDALENFDESQNVFIYDKETDTYNSIKNKLYEVELPEGYLTERFSLRFRDKTLGVKDVIYENSIQVVFTRSNNVLNITNGSNDNTVVNVSLFNIQGKLISKWDVADKEQTSIKIPIQNKTSGVYIVKLKTTKGNINKKIIIK